MDDVATSGGFVIPAGQWMLHVQGHESASRGYFGSYQLSLYEVPEAPEGRTNQVAVGDTISEALDPLGDADEYTLLAKQGDHIELVFSMLGPRANSSFALEVGTPANPRSLGSFFASAAADSFATQFSSRVTLNVPGPYTIRVAPGNGSNSAEYGPYRVIVRRFPSTPETHTSAIALGADITNEALDYLGDVDEYVLHATPGTTASVFLTADPTVQSLAVEVIDSTTQSVLARTQAHAGRESTGSFTIPPSGAVVVRVAEARFEPSAPYRLKGPYRLEALATVPP